MGGVVEERKVEWGPILANTRWGPCRQVRLLKGRNRPPDERNTWKPTYTILQRFG